MISDIQSRCWILALFVRDDGERLLLGDGAYDFLDKQQHFTANSYENDTVEVQGNDGIMLAGQVRRGSAQSFDGYIGDGTTSKENIEEYRRQFLAFFRKNHFYEVIYIFTNGTAIKRQRGFIVDAPEVKELWQVSPQYHVALNFEDVNYYEYAENEAGEEIYGSSATIPLVTATSGGLVWDEVGAVWDSIGAVWEGAGGGGIVDISVDSIDTVYPVLTITGPANNPVVENITTATEIAYSGNVAIGQTLVVDMNAQTAKINGTNVLKDISGNWLRFSPGVNRVSYSAANNDAPDATIEWSEVVG